MDYEGGSYLPAGWHTVTVTGFELKGIGDKGTPAVEFTLADTDDRMVKKVFYLTDGALVFLGRFAVDCGLTEAERRAYDVDNKTSHRILIGKRIQVEVYKRDGKYSAVDDNWAPIGENVSDRPADPAVDRSAEPSRPPSDPGDIPF